MKVAEMYFQLLTTGETIEIIKLDTRSKSDKENEKWVFNSSHSPITIGRNKKCSIAYTEEKSFSRIQTTIHFVNNRWEVMDGGEKPSTNGTW
jgi:pSer/pThr/pTyr-binding forkhead associated (FHA) protein